MDFEVDTRYTLDEFLRFNKAVIVANLLRKDIFVAALFYIFSILFLMCRGDYSRALFLFLFMVIVTPATVVVLHRNAKKTWDTNELIKDIVNHYRFLDDRFYVSSPSGTSNIEYLKLYGIIETRTNFYLMISNNMGYIISKYECTDEQQSFIRSIESKKKLKLK